MGRLKFDWSREMQFYSRLWDVVRLLLFSTYDLPLLTERKNVYEAFEDRALCN